MDKAPDAFRTISEVADDLDIPQHVLRFWESRFPQIKPMKRAGGRRYYRPDDVDLLRGIRHLLYGEGYTIRGVQRILKENGVRFVQSVWQAGAAQPSPQDEDLADEQAAVKAGTGGGLFGILSGRSRAADDEDDKGQADTKEGDADDAPRQAEPSARSLAPQDIQKLQAVLHNLLECRRLLRASGGNP